jgi:hypothetical protein
MTIKSSVFWDITPWSSVKINRYFGTRSLVWLTLGPWTRRRYVPPKHRWLPSDYTALCLKDTTLLTLQLISTGGGCGLITCGHLQACNKPVRHRTLYDTAIANTGLDKLLRPLASYTLHDHEYKWKNKRKLNIKNIFETSGNYWRVSYGHILMDRIPYKTF